MDRVCRIAAASAVLLGSSAPADAHRLDELLQATRIGIEPGHIDIELDLTPGADIAPGLVNAIDTNGNGRFDGREFNDFTHAAGRGLRLTLDGQTVRVSFLRWEIAPAEALRQGTGSMRFFATVPTPGGAGHHVLWFANEFAPASSAFLVNALTPSDPRVQLGSPARDPQQRTFTLEYDISRPRWIPWTAIGTLLVGGLLRARRRVPADR